MQSLINTIRQHAQDVAARIGQPRYGVITSVDPVRHLAKVMLQPEAVQTGWLEIGTPVPGWQMLPAIGSQAVVVPREGDSANGIIVCYSYSNPSPPPSVPNAPGTGGVRATAGVPLSGTEMVMAGPGGAFIRLLPGGNLLLSAVTLEIDANVTMNGTLTTYGTITTTNGNILANTGNIQAYGSITDRNGTHGSVDTLRQAYNGHVHTQGNDSHGDTEVPTNITASQV